MDFLVGYFIGGVFGMFIMAFLQMCKEEKKT